MPCNVYVLRRGPMSKPRYDAAFGFVVVADDEAQARQMAAQQCGDEGPDVWLSGKLTVDILGEALPGHMPNVWLRDFNAG